MSIWFISTPQEYDMTQPFTLGRDLMLQVRAGLLLQNMTLSSWCRQHGINTSNARQAIYGTWNGPKGRTIRDELLKAAGVKVAV